MKVLDSLREDEMLIMIIQKPSANIIGHLKPRTWTNPNSIIISRGKFKLFSLMRSRFLFTVAENLNKNLDKKLYGRPWDIGVRYFDTLRALGVSKDSKILDVGCGSGRLGRHLVEFLNDERYVGIDPHEFAIRSFEKFLLKTNKSLVAKLYLGRFEDYKELFINDFDFIVDLYCSHHFESTEFEIYISDLKEKMNEQSVIIWLGDIQKWGKYFDRHFTFKIYDDGVDQYLILKSKSIIKS